MDKPDKLLRESHAQGSSYWYESIYNMSPKGKEFIAMEVRIVGAFGRHLMGSCMREPSQMWEIVYITIWKHIYIC